MELEKLKQRRFLNKREYKLDDSHVVIKEGNLLSSQVYKIKYENISDEDFEITTYSKPLFWFTLFFISLLIFQLLTGFANGNIGGSVLVWAGFAILFGLFSWNSRIHFIGFKCYDQPLLFYKNNPSASELNSFIEKYFQKRNHYLKENYLTNDQYTSASDEIQKLAWLKENGVITVEEFEELKKQIIERNPGNIIGFQN